MPHTFRPGSATPYGRWPTMRSCSDAYLVATLAMLRRLGTVVHDEAKGHHGPEFAEWWKTMRHDPSMSTWARSGTPWSRSSRILKLSRPSGRQPSTEKAPEGRKGSRPPSGGRSPEPLRR